MSLRSLRWTAFAVAVVVLGLDQGSKQWAVRALASFDHPMVVAGPAGATVSAALQRRGLSVAEVERAIGRGQVRRYLPTKGLAGDRVLTAEDGDTLLLATDGVGLPAPRHSHLARTLVGQTVGQVVARDFGIAEAQVQGVLDGPVLRAAGRIDSADQPLGADAILAVSERRIDVAPGFALVYAENRGAAWGFMANAAPATRFGLFVAVSVIASLVMAWILWKGRMATLWSTVALAAILGGAVGNLTDRLRFRVVVDFVLNYVVVDGKTIAWPVYNIADVGITVGVVVIALAMLRQPRPSGAVAGPARPG